MKNLFYFQTVFVVLLSISCSKEVLVRPSGEGNPVIKKTIDISIVGGNATAKIGDPTIYVQRNSPISMKIVTDRIAIYGCAWEFYKNDTIATGISVVHSFNALPATGYVKVTCVDTLGNVYEVFREIVVVPDINDYYGVRCLALSKNNDGSFTITLAIDKSGANYRGDQYAYIGNITNMPWSGPNYIPFSDTNYNIEKGIATPAIDGTGKWILISIKLNNYGFRYNLGVGKVVDGLLIWGNFWGPFVSPENATLIGFTVTLDQTGNLKISY